MNPEGIVISPGPCTPLEAGISNDVILHMGQRVPILGVCLGHQAVGYVFGATVGLAEEIMHGKTSEIKHYNTSLFKGIKNNFIATRYHSLIIDRKSLGKNLLITAETKDNVIMGIMHKNFNVHGVQFHPESIKTSSGLKILLNFLKYEK